MVELTDRSRRLFVALDIPDEIKAALSTGRPWPGRPVPPENLHLTLRFLGSTDQIRYERLLAALAAIQQPGFLLRFDGLGAFPNPRKATVLWLGLATGAAELAALADLVEEAAQNVGFQPEDRPFHPHLTLSRIRPHQDVSTSLDREVANGMSVKVNEFLLMESHLGRGGARYEILDRFPLGLSIGCAIHRTFVRV